MHGAVGEVNYRPSRSLGVGVNTDKEGAWFVMLSAHTLEGEFVSGLVVVGAVLVAPLEAEGLVPEVADLHRLHSMLAPRCTIVSSIHGSQYQWTPSRLALLVVGTSLCSPRRGKSRLSSGIALPCQGRTSATSKACPLWTCLAGGGGFGALAPLRSVHSYLCG